MMITDTHNEELRIIEVTPIEMIGHTWLCVGFEDANTDMGDFMHLAFLYVKDFVPSNDLHNDMKTILSKDRTSPLLRVHSECLLGDAFYSDLCDCGEQLRAGLRSIINHGLGAVLYLRQEGRGIGMRAKLACLAAQEGFVGGQKTMDRMTPDAANLHYGFKVDERTYEIVPMLLNLLNVNEVVMMTGNMDKVSAVSENNIIVQSLVDIDRRHIPPGSRKHLELSEKAARNYNYQIQESL